MRIRLPLLLMLALSAWPTLSATAADKRSERFALVIGNAKYPDAEAPLKEPIADARALSEELKRDGFDVELGENLGNSAMRRALEHFYERIKPGSVALLFFSGFGVQSSGQSFLLPVDAQIWSEADVRRDGTSLETVLAEINRRGADVKIALLDASRRNPFERRFRSFSAGLAAVTAPNGTLVMYSAALNSVVGDNDGEHSALVRELLKEMRVPGAAAEETLNRTRADVTQASHKEQIPWISFSLTQDFSFIPDASAKTLPTPQTSTASLLAPTPIAGVAPVLARAVPSADALIPPPAAASAPQPQPAAVPAVAKPSTAPAPKEEPVALALADDPTVKGLTAKIADNPDDGASLYRRGQVYAAKGAYDLAIKDFDDSLRLNPKDVEAYNNRCWTRAVIGDLRAALKDCNEALRLRPNFVDALDSRGLVNLKNGQNKNAIIDFDAALGINPKLTSSLYGRGVAKQRNGDAVDGELDIADAKALDPNIVKEFADYGVR